MNERLFHSFVRISQELTQDLKADCPLSELDQLRLENYLAMLHMAYVEWKQRNNCPTLTNLVHLSQNSHRDDGSRILSEQ
jgi:hypothetical protein